MSTETPTTTATRRPARSRWRVLLGILALCLAIWGIKAIHYALQPKYQGKTMEEWFEASYSAVVLFQQGYPHRFGADDPAIEAMRHFGTDAVRYLWREGRREDFEIIRKIRNFWNGAVTEQGQVYMIDTQMQRRMRAEALLTAVRTNAAFLIPELITQVDGHDLEDSVRAASWMGVLRIRPEECVPALMRALTETQRIPPVNQGFYAYVLGLFGKDAEQALPLLLEIHQNPNTGVLEKGALAAAIVQIDSARKHPEYLARVLDTNDSSITVQALLLPARAGNLSTSVLPQVRIFADKVTDSRHKQYLTNVIGILETTKRP